jgi:hypothetical protein
MNDNTETTVGRPVYKPGFDAGLNELCEHYHADVKWLEAEIDRRGPKSLG